jgi:hypothetical protein
MDMGCGARYEEARAYDGIAVFTWFLSPIPMVRRKNLVKCSLSGRFQVLLYSELFTFFRKLAIIAVGRPKSEDRSSIENNPAFIDSEQVRQS